MCTCNGGEGLGHRWWLWGSVGVTGYWPVLLFSILGLDSVIQLFEKCNKFLKFLGDVIGQGKSIFDLIVQALHECSTFCRFILLNISSILLKFHIVDREVVICFFECL
jgi:hypothetical protein